MQSVEQLPTRVRSEMEHQRYTATAEELPQQLKRMRVPSGAVVHFWYEVEKPTQSVSTQKSRQRKSWKDTDIFGMWADREDMADVDAYVRKIRQPRF